MIINQKELAVPIIQGGMGVAISLSNLAGHVAKCGAMGVISSVNAGFASEEFQTNPKDANEKAFRQEIRRAKEIAGGKGLVAVNIMVATNFYNEMAQAAVEEGADAIISGAGLPMNLPQYTKGTPTMAAPIVSSGKAAKLICKSWDRKHGVAPDFIVIEGSKAGGHLGFKREELEDGTAETLEQILPQVLQEIKPYEEKYERKIPVFVAGGVFDGADLAHFMNIGASGAQIATRFIATEECDASQGFKDVILKAKDEDAILVKSPVGMPGRAVKSPLLNKLADGQTFPSPHCNGCLSVCPRGDKTPYCISQALIDAVQGKWESGLFFCGANVGKVNKIVKVSELIDEIMNEWRNS